MDQKVIKELKNYSYLNWAKTRNSSGTGGSFLKSFEIVNNKKIYYKLSNYSQIDGIIGHEAINEIIVDRFLTLMNIPHLEYKLHHAKVVIDSREYETYFCSSIDYKNKGDSKMPLDLFYKINKKEDESILEFLERNNFLSEIYTMMIADYLILNRDRHGANIEVLKSSKNENFRLAPLFDHGLSLLFSCHNDKEIEKFNVLEDKKIQSFVGSNSAYNNLFLIPKENLFAINKLSNKDKKYLFYDLEDLISKKHQEKIFELLTKRSEIYEKLCNKR